jgi:hypothetical protein
VRRWRPNLADGSQRLENLISKFLNLVAAAYILASQVWTLARIRLVGFAGMLTLLTSTVVPFPCISRTQVISHCQY